MGRRGLRSVSPHLRQDVVQGWHVLVIAFCAGAVESFDGPARQSLYPHLIDRRVMVSAVALNSCVWQGTRIIAPAVAGCIVAWAGTAVAFYLAGLGFLTMATVIRSKQPQHPARQDSSLPLPLPTTDLAMM